jgi:membrane-bound serine protease (ClpP class)
VICLILGLYAMHTLPVNYAGLGLVLVGIIFFLLEIKITSYGLLTIGGIISLGLGSIMLFQHESGFDVIGVSWEVILGAIVFTGLFFFVAIGMGIRAQRRKPTTGIQGIIGERGEALTELAPHGQVRIHGEIWSARSLDGALAPGTPVVVESVSGLTLHVRTHHSQ